MTERASLIQSRTRSTPRTYVHSGGHQTLEILTTDHAVMLISMAVQEIRTIDSGLVEIEQEVMRIGERLETADEWDELDLEVRLDAVLERWVKVTADLLMRANEITFAGRYLIAEWREVDLDNIARQLHHHDPVFRRVAVEWPHVLDDPVWQRLQQEAVPF
jgi:hypothetical protein